jgi:hypothetical protein
MAGLTDAAESLALDWLLVVGTPTRPAGTFVALYTVSPTDTTAGTEVTNANAYARQAVTFNAAGTDGITENSGVVTFPAATGSWGTIVAMGIVTSATYGAGNLTGYGAATPNKTVGNTDIVEFAAGAIVVQFTD